MAMKRFMFLGLVSLLALTGCGAKSEVDRPAQKEDVVLAQVEVGVATERSVATGQVVGPTGRPAVPMVEAEKATSQESGLIIADFEGWPSNLGGEIGVYGALEPDWEKVNEFPMSWVYDPISLNYSPANVHGGKNCFRLVNALGVKPEFTWGSFAMDLGPTMDITTTPKRVVSLDVSKYGYLVFWAKGEKGGEKMELVIRDAHALNYSPQVKYGLPDLTDEWQRVVVPLADIAGKVDLTQLDNIGLAFGKDIGNMKGDIAYIDDFIFTNNAE